MMLIFPFEEKIYEESDIPAVFVGHPLQEKIRTTLTRQQLLEKYGLDSQKKLITLLPGSRTSELKNHMPVLAEAIYLIKNEWDTHFFLLLAEGLDKNLISDFLRLFPDDLFVFTENHYEAISASDIVLSACGTANLEAALLETPLLFGRWLAKIDNFSIVNILAGTRIIPELIQRDFTPENIFQESKRILESEEIRSEMISHFRKIKKILGENVASQNAAKELHKIIFGDVPQGTTS